MQNFKSLAAFASDLGGAYQLFHFVKKNPILKKFKKFFFFKGDSESLIKKNEKGKISSDLNYDLIICSTSGNDYEKKIIDIANKKKKKYGLFLIIGLIIKKGYLIREKPY